MAVGRLSGAWILEILRTHYPEGVLRRALLDQFAALLVTARSSRGAKGRVARRLYARLDGLQRKGLIVQAEGVVRPLEPGRPRPRREAAPLMGTVLRGKLFRVLMAEDRPGERDAARLRQLRWEFLAGAVSEGWTVPQAAEALGLELDRAKEIVARPKG